VTSRHGTTRIKALNAPEVANALPSQPIRVVIQSVASAITTLFTTMLNDTVPKFAKRVGAGSLVRFPVASSNTTTLVTDNEAIIREMAAKAYSFAITTQYDAVLVRP
jgi:ABC-type phosphate transport system substrate-binding protein